MPQFQLIIKSEWVAFYCYVSLMKYFIKQNFIFMLDIGLLYSVNHRILPRGLWSFCLTVVKQLKIPIFNFLPGATQSTIPIVSFFDKPKPKHSHLGWREVSCFAWINLSVHLRAESNKKRLQANTCKVLHSGTAQIQTGRESSCTRHFKETVFSSWLLMSHYYFYVTKCCLATGKNKRWREVVL